MLILAFDTSTTIGSMALWSEKGLVSLFTTNVEQTHSEGLIPALKFVLNYSNHYVDDISAVACVCGPGSYTGLRIGICTAQGVAYTCRLPCFAFNSLDILARAAGKTPYLLVPLVPARKDWLYTRLYRWQNDEVEAVSEELNIQPDELITHIHEPAMLYGPGLMPYVDQFKGMLKELFIPLPDVFNQPRADIVAELAAERFAKGEMMLEPDELTPHYLGPSQAEINWKKR